MIKPGSNAFNLITRYSRKRLASPNAAGIMEVMDNKQVMDFVQDLVGEFNRFGIPESAITVVDDVGKFANQIVDINHTMMEIAILMNVLKYCLIFMVLIIILCLSYFFYF